MRAIIKSSKFNNIEVAYIGQIITSFRYAGTEYSTVELFGMVQDLTLKSVTVHDTHIYIEVESKKLKLVD